MQFDKKSAVKFVVLMGVISLFADMTYEGARSINGSFLKILGTSGATVGWVAGLGELIGYALRFISGYIADKTRKYWLISIVGYTLNLFSVPLLALAGYWQLAVGLMICERIGKAIRSPSRDALLSFGAKTMGVGWGYGLHEAMDQIGAFLGPIIVGLILIARNNNYTLSYAVLLLPALAAFGILIFAMRIYPNPEKLEVKTKNIEVKGYNRAFWWYVFAIVFIAAGYVDFPLIAYHFKLKALMSDSTIPMMYAVAMASDAVAALILGKLFDKIGVKSLMLAIILSAFFAPMVFFGGIAWIITGMVLWGIGMGAQESILRAVIADLIPQEKRGTAFGTFNAAYGVFWFLGSAFMGYMYDYSLLILAIFSVATQVAGLFILIWFNRFVMEKKL